eukprot:PhF_6_TR34160/c0_g1_i4/m.49936/K10573/UBE2A, UBC2, RAD6A; ubiquitin-conjugating enzyme E2 A
MKNNMKQKLSFVIQLSFLSFFRFDRSLLFLFMSLGWRFRQEPHVVRSMWMLMLRYRECEEENQTPSADVVPFHLFSDIIQVIFDLLTTPPKAFRRIQKECEKARECEAFLRCLVDEHDMYHWTVEVEGPPGTPYEDCWWTFDVTIPEHEYPFKPPKVMCVDYKFMFHPNFHPTDGSICMQTLKDRWSPQYTIAAIMSEVRDLMKSPNFDVYVNHECGISYVSGTYAEKARELSSALRIQQ